MSFLDKIKEYFTNNKKNAKIIVENLVKKYGEPEPFIVALYEENKFPLVGKTVTININGRDYERVTDTEGIARLNINLQPGEYTVLISFKDNEYNLVTSWSKVIVQSETRMEGTDINMNYQDGTQYQCAVYSNTGRVAGTVDLTINGKTYRKTPDETGLYKLNINLQPGNYMLTAQFQGDNVNLPSSIVNSIVVKEPPVSESTPKECTNQYISSPHPTNSGCNGMGQNNSVCCGPSAIHKSIYKFGIRDITQNQIASWAGTTSAGTSHSGLETAIAMINKVKGTNIKIKWYNLSDLGWDSLGNLICQPNIAAFTHVLYKNGGTCKGSGNFGHYESITKINMATGYIKVINSLGSKCGSCYCGYYQDRTMACEEVFISGISQKSIAILSIN